MKKKSPVGDFYLNTMINVDNTGLTANANTTATINTFPTLLFFIQTTPLLIINIIQSIGVKENRIIPV
jgi:hypothetical protein